MVPSPLQTSPLPPKTFVKVDAETGGKAAGPPPRVSRRCIKKTKEIRQARKRRFPGLSVFLWIIMQRDSRRTASPPVESLWRWRGGVRGGEEEAFLQKGSSSPPRFLSHPYFPNRRKRSALSTTETDEKAIAAPAIMGESEGPPKILSTPAAMGRQRML